MACGGDDGGRTDQAIPLDTIPASIPAPVVEGGVVLIEPERVREWQTAQEPIVVVDARDRVQYAQEHLPGSINIPYVDIRPGALLPPRDARIVVYCSDEDCPISRYAYQSLQQLGYRDVYDMQAGLQGWKAAGYPTVVGEAAEDTAPPADTPPPAEDAGR